MFPTRFLVTLICITHLPVIIVFTRSDHYNVISIMKMMDQISGSRPDSIHISLPFETRKIPPFFFFRFIMKLQWTHFYIIFSPFLYSELAHFTSSSSHSASASSASSPLLPILWLLWHAQRASECRHLQPPGSCRRGGSNTQKSSNFYVRGGRRHRSKKKKKKMMKK